jgi:plasmid stability protein
MPDGAPTASLTIRQLDPGLKDRLRARAAQHGRSMAEEARAILDAALPADAADPESGASLVEAALRIFGPEHGFELDLPPREPMGPPPSFE